MTGEHLNEKLKQHSVFTKTKDWNLFKTWCNLKGLKVTEKGGEIIMQFVRTVVEPDLRSRKMIE